MVESLTDNNYIKHTLKFYTNIWTAFEIYQVPAQPEFKNDIRTCARWWWYRESETIINLTTTGKYMRKRFCWQPVKWCQNIRLCDVTITQLTNLSHTTITKRCIGDSFHYFLCSLDIWIAVNNDFDHSRADSPMIFTRDCVPRENLLRIISLVTKNYLFTSRHILHFMFCPNQTSCLHINCHEENHHLHPNC